MAYQVMPDGSIRLTPDGGPPMDVPPGVFDLNAPAPLVPDFAMPGYTPPIAEPPPGMFPAPGAPPIPPGPGEPPAGMMPGGPPPSLGAPQLEGPGAPPPGLFRAPPPPAAPPPAAQPARGTPGTSGLEQTVNDATAAKQESIARSATADAKAQADQGAELVRIEDKNKRMIENETEARKAAQVQADKFAQELVTEADAIAKSKLDPQRAFKDAGPVGQAFAMIGLFLGGAMQVRTGQPNAAAKGLEQIMERDLQAQIQDVESKKSGLGTKQSLYAQYLDRTKDADKARALTRVAMIESQIQRVKAEGMISSSPQTQERAVQLIADLDIQKANAIQEARGKDYDRKLDAERVKIARSQVGLGYQQLKENARQFDEELKVKVKELTLKGDAAGLKALQDQAGKAVYSLKDPNTGATFIAPDEIEARKARLIVANATTLDGLLAQREALRAKYGHETDNFILTTDAAKEMNALDTTIMGVLKDQMELGAWDNGTQKLLTNMIGDARGFKDPTPATRQVRQAAIIKTNNYLRGLGYDPRDKDGNQIMWNPAGKGGEPIDQPDPATEKAGQSIVYNNWGLVDQPVRGTTSSDEVTQERDALYRVGGRLPER